MASDESPPDPHSDSWREFLARYNEALSHNPLGPAIRDIAWQVSRIRHRQVNMEQASAYMVEKLPEMEERIIKRIGDKEAADRKRLWRAVGAVVTAVLVGVPGVAEIIQVVRSLL